MKIHIVSNNRLYSKEIKSIIRNVAKKNLSKEMLDSDKKVYFVDIDEDPLGNLSFANKHNDSNKYIIIVSKDDAHSLEAYRIHAWGYLLKPLTKDIILSELLKISTLSK